MKPLQFLKAPAAIAATAIILVQAALLYSAVRPESVPASQPLVTLPEMFSGWHFTEEGVVDQETRDVLKADDLLNRYYSNGMRGVNLFVAAFRSQRDGKAPHSPKNCLPGSGWQPSSSTIVSVPVHPAACG